MNSQPSQWTMPEAREKALGDIAKVQSILDFLAAVDVSETSEVAGTLNGLSYILKDCVSLLGEAFMTMNAIRDPSPPTP